MYLVFLKGSCVPTEGGPPAGEFFYSSVQANLDCPDSLGLDEIVWIIAVQIIENMTINKDKND